MSAHTDMKYQALFGSLTLKAPIGTAANRDKFCEIFPNFRKNKVWNFMRIVCWQTILMKYAIFVNFEKEAKFKFFSSAANYRWRFKG